MITVPSLAEKNPFVINTAIQQLAQQLPNSPRTVTAATDTMLSTDDALIFNGSGTITETLLPPSAVKGQFLHVKTIAAQAVNSASSNVVPIGSTTAGTAILPATSGACATLQSDGTNWVTIVSAAPAAGGTLNGPGSTTVGDIVLWNNTTGTLVSDSAVAITTTAQYLANTASKALTTDQVWAADVPVTLTDGATVTPNFGAGINFSWTIAGNRTLANPTNQKVGQTGYIAITQDATGSRTIATWGTNYIAAGGTKPVLTTAANALDILYYQVVATSKVLVSIVNNVS